MLEYQVSQCPRVSVLLKLQNTQLVTLENIVTEG